MTDIEAAIRAYLVTCNSVPAYFGQRIYGGQDMPPGYNPDTSGPGLLFAVRGGGQDYSSHMLNPSVQFRCYASSEAAARGGAFVLYDALNDKSNAQIEFARMEQLPTLLQDPDTLWFYALVFFDVKVRN